jgi:alkylhydroperoxidase family enzyme
LHFSEKEIADLTILIGMINLWNRIAIGFRYAHPVEAGAGKAA